MSDIYEKVLCIECKWYEDEYCLRSDPDDPDTAFAPPDPDKPRICDLFDKKDNKGEKI
jgi:hypothetical protein